MISYEQALSKLSKELKISKSLAKKIVSTIIVNCSIIKKKENHFISRNFEKKLTYSVCSFLFFCVVLLKHVFNKNTINPQLSDRMKNYLKSIFLKSLKNQ